MRDTTEFKIQSFKNTFAYHIAFVKLKWDRYSISSGLILGLIPMLGYLIGALLDGVLFLPGTENIGLLEDPAFLSWFVIVFLVIVFIQGFYSRLERFFEDFDGAIDHRKYSIEAYKSQVSWVDSCVAGKGRYIAGKSVCYLLGLICATFVAFGILLPTSTVGTSWSDLARYRYVFYIGIPISFFYWGYLVPTAIWHLLSATWGIWRVVNNVSDARALILRPIAPDQAGGLRPLGSLSLSMVYTVLSPMIWIALLILMFGGEIGTGPLILIVVYLCLVAVIFFFPLGSAHEAMQEAKEEELKTIAEHFNTEYDKLKITLRTQNQEQDANAEDAFLRLERLHRVYERADSMPVWPFDTRTLLRFGTTLGIPITLTILNVALGRFG